MALIESRAHCDVDEVMVSLMSTTGVTESRNNSCVSADGFYKFLSKKALHMYRLYEKHKYNLIM